MILFFNFTVWLMHLFKIWTRSNSVFKLENIKIYDFYPRFDESTSNQVATVFEQIKKYINAEPAGVTKLFSILYACARKNINIIDEFRGKGFDDASILCFRCFIFLVSVWFFLSLSLAQPSYVPRVFRPKIDTDRKLTSSVYIITPVLRSRPQRTTAVTRAI